MYLRVLFDMPSLSHGHGLANKTQLVHSQRVVELRVSFPPSCAVIHSVASSIVIQFIVLLVEPVSVVYYLKEYRAMYGRVQ